MKLNLNNLEEYEDDDFLEVERFGRKPSFKSEDYRREKKGDSIRRKRQQKQREREQLLEDSEDFHYGEIED